jgi:hypothetical protein
MTVKRDPDSLRAYYLRQYKKNLKDLATLINGELTLLNTDDSPTCLSALQMMTDNTPGTTALQELELSGYRASYSLNDKWLTGKIIAIYASGMVVMDAGLPDGTRHCVKLTDLHPPF